MRRVMIPVAAAGLLVVAQAPAQEAEPVGPVPQLVSVGTAAVSGMYFPVGVALCRLVNQHRRETGLRCAARPSGGSVANVGGLRDGAFELALVQSDTQAEAVAGIGAFAAVGPSDDLRAVMSLYPEALTLVVRADSGIARVEDLAGKRVWLGAEGSGTRDLAADLMNALGWTEASLAEVPEVSTDRLGDALCHDEIAGFSTPSAILRWRSRKPPPSATRGWWPLTAQRSMRWFRQGPTSCRRRSRVASTAETRAVPKPSASWRRW